MTPGIPDLVLLGNLLVDDVVFADGRTRMGEPGGAMLYAAHAAALWGACVGCVSLQGDDYPAAALEALRARGVLLDGVHPLRASPSSSARGSPQRTSRGTQERMASSWARR